MYTYSLIIYQIKPEYLLLPLADRGNLHYIFAKITKPLEISFKKGNFAIIFTISKKTFEFEKWFYEFAKNIHFHDIHAFLVHATYSLKNLKSKYLK